MWSSIINGETLFEIYTKDIDVKEKVNEDIDFGIEYDINLGGIVWEIK